MTLSEDLSAMRGVWHDRLSAFDRHGVALTDDPHGGVPGPFPYDNLVYVDFDGELYRQTNVTFSGRPFAVRTFEADVADDVLTFRSLGGEAPEHVGVSAGPGRIWFVAAHLGEPGLQRYAEPDLITLDTSIEPATRTRDTVLYRDGTLVRTLHVTGTRLALDTTCVHSLDPRPAGSEPHTRRSSTDHYRAPSRRAPSLRAPSPHEPSNA